jgi:hypothetical protein
MSEDKWGDPISIARQDELHKLWVRQTEWEAKSAAERGDSPLKGVGLNGADVSWFVKQGKRNVIGLFTDLHLEGVDLSRAHLEGARLSDAYLEGVGADLQIRLAEAHLEGADLREAWLDSTTVLSGARLDRQTRLGDIQWSGVGAVNLTRLPWDQVKTLGDEQGVDKRSKASEHEAVVRAYRQLAAQLRVQGMSEVADRFAYRAQVRQRRVVRKQGRIAQWLGSWAIAALAGYGFKPGRTILWYLGLIAAFATAYYLLGPTQGHTFQPDGALVFSLTSFHGRGFFPESLSFESWVTRLAALEAVLGLLIEISFIATFTQRFFGAK